MPTQLTLRQLAPSLKIDGGIVTLTLADFEKLARLAAERMVVDEKWYLERYPDVKAAIGRKELFFAAEHFRRHGFIEGRASSAQTVDPSWYIATYPDVDAAIRAGHFKSAQEHFDLAGLNEGRLPHKV